MGFTELFIYSLIQGVTEFLPISSSAHLLLLEDVFNWEGAGRTYAIAAHLGTLLTLLFFLRLDIYNLLKNVRIKETKKNQYNKLLFNITIITTPVIIFGFLIFKTLDNFLLSIEILGWASIIGALLLLIADKLPYNNKTILDLSFKESIFIGILQSFSLIPGSSRAGMIITASRFLKISRKNSTKIALFTGIPTITAAVILEFYWLFNHAYQFFTLKLVMLILMSSIFSYLTIVFLLKWLNKNSFLPFIIYRLILGIIILVLI